MSALLAGPVSVLRETMPDVATLAPALPLVGRENELDELRAAWARARSGEANAVVLAGDAGIGKTRLLSEVVGEVTAEDGLALVGHCLGLGQAAPPFLPVLEVLTQLRDSAPNREVAEAATQLLTADVAGDQVRFFDGVQTLLAQAAESAPVLVVVEDLHWADPSTRDLLLFLLSRLGTSRVLLVLSYRSDDLERAHPLRPWLASVARMRGVERVDVAPLARAEAEEFVRGLLADAASDDVVKDVADRSEGNAFFAEELSNAATGGRAEISDVLASVLLDRFERLSGPAQHVVRAAAIVGQRDLWASSLEQLAASKEVGVAPEEIGAALRECVQSHVLVVTPDGAFAFRHALLREAVLADMLPGEGARLHTAYLPILEREQPTGWRAAQAYHAARAGDLTLAVQAHVAASDAACEVAAHGDALAHLEKALELWPAVKTVEGLDELTLVLGASDEAASSGRVDRAISFARQGVALADEVGTDLQRAGARRRLAKLLAWNGDWREAERHIAKAWTLLEDQEATAERAWVLSTMSYGEASAERRGLAERAIAEARAVGAPGPEADALISLAFLLQHDGEVDLAMETLQEAREKAHAGAVDDTELRAYFNLAMLRYDRGELAEAAKVAADGSRVAAEHGRSWAGYGREVNWLVQLVDLARGDFDVVIERAGRWLNGVTQNARPMVLQSRALASMWRGDWEQVEADAEAIASPAALAGDVLRGSTASVMGATAVLESWLWRGRSAEVIDTILTAQESPEYPDEMIELRVGAMLLTAYADAARRQRQGGGDVDQERVAAVETALERVERISRDAIPRGEKIGPEGLMWLARARAEAARARGDDDPDLWRAVLDAGYAEVPQLALARWRLGEALLEQGEEGGAEELSAAHESARAMGAAPLRSAIEATARRFRVPLAGSAPAGAVLTPREQSVLELVAKGMTNRAIGAELFISEKTVSVHLTRTMAKLGATSRTEAVAIAMSRGLI